MIYSDYARRKFHNVVKIDTKEGYPLTVYNCANKNLKDYTIYGNTGGVGDKTENVFNYTEQSRWTYMVKPDEDGWFDVTIDNSNGSSAVRKSCYTTVNHKLKTNTKYYIKYEEAERSGNPIVRVISIVTSGDVGQFADSALVNASGYRTTLSSFDSCSTMLRTYVTCDAGKSCHVKFRIAVYETEKNYFEPYDKYKIPITVTGNNLFDISKSDGFTSQYTGLTNTITDNVITVSSTTNRIGYLTLGTFEAGTYYIGMTSEDYTGLQRITVNNVDSKISVNNLITISERSVIKIMINVGAGTTWHFTNIQITKSNVATSYEPYHKPVTTNIYRDSQLGQGESINYKSDSLPYIMLKKGTNTITADTEVKPSNIKIKYLKK